ncbi:RBCMT, partial [Symbiodinium pilosum]
IPMARGHALYDQGEIGKSVSCSAQQRLLHFRGFGRKGGLASFPQAVRVQPFLLAASL